MSPNSRNDDEALATTPILSPSPASSTHSSVNDLKSMDTTKEAHNLSKGKSLKERSQIPASFYLVVAAVVSLQYCSGLYQEETLIRWYDSVSTSAQFTAEYCQNAVELVQRAVMSGEVLEDETEYAKLALVFVFGFSLFYVFIWAPLRAGFWTGSRATKHVFHRYMGLAYLTQYFFVWVEFATNYENGAKTSVLPHFIALNGLAQGMSAFLSFKVLPELNDAGYYSDKAVLSRSFVHENIFFTLMCVFGTIYNYEPTRLALRTSAWGKFVEYCFVFWPFVVVRPFFPITRFKDAGKTRKGRSNINERFYQVGTLMVKFFYLWAKYLLGFFTNFLLFLELVPEKHSKFLQGFFLLNLGTVSVSIFLHTLRFRKVLPARFTFSIYLLQIYLTFLAIPLAYDMFCSHLTLVSVCMAGVACNMTRNRKMHAVWCLGVMLLLGNRDYQWLGRQIDW